MQHARQTEATPLAREIIYAEPFAMARRLKGTKALTLFESVQRHEHLGRYSFLACAPASTMVVKEGVAYLDGKAMGDPPFVLLEKLLAAKARPTLVGLPPFQGGWAGFISYDYGRHLEPKAKIAAFAAIAPDMVFHRFDTVIAVDHLQERAWIIAGSEAEADALEKQLAQPQHPLGAYAVQGFTSNLPQPAYEAAVAATVEDILAGDIFQANITQTFAAAAPQDFDAFALYKRLRDRNPATFAALCDYDELKIISSSPERLVKCEGAKAEARPIKGTRPRFADSSRDAASRTELQASRKDRAENVMIVDLLRNDLSRVCQPGSVQVPVLCGLESYANVHHLVSVVEGELKPGISTPRLVQALFPGGSITGAPKIRAMEIITAREQAPRGVYCGAIGYFGFNGACDFNIAIRTVQVAGGVPRLQGGGGITARSRPAEEYEESLTKIARIMEALAP